MLLYKKLFFIILFIFPLFLFSQTNTEQNTSKEKGSEYCNITEMSYGLGLSEQKRYDSFGIHTINGFMIDPNISLGIGIGCESHVNAVFIPIFCDVRAYFSKENKSPYLSFIIGKSFGVGEDKGGLLVNPSLGVKISKTPIHFNLGYKLQQNSYLSGLLTNHFTVKETLNYLLFKLGVTF